MRYPNLQSPSPILSDQINAATRSAHTHLNRLIIERLPLALPPYTFDPSIYVSGLVHIAPIYVTFEDLWICMIKSTGCSREENHRNTPFFQYPENKNLEIGNNSRLQNTDVSSDNKTSRPCSRIESILNFLLLPDLLRADILRDDIGKLTSTSEQEVRSRIEAISNDGSLSRFLEHIKKNVKKNPHVLLAYAWVLYMALFSGGRYIRSTLKEAGGYGHRFWKRTPTVPLKSEKGEAERELTSIGPDAKPTSNFPIVPADTVSSKVISGLGLFYFTGDADGEEIKIEFKKRMRQVESQLTKKERDDIVMESQYIFKFMIEMIRDLDSLQGTHKDYEDNLLITKELKSLTIAQDSASLTRQRLWLISGNQITTDAWESSTFGIKLKNKMTRLMTCISPFIAFSEKGVYLNRYLSKSYISDIKGYQGFFEKNSGFSNQKFLVVQLMGFLLLFFCTFLTLKIICAR